MHPVFDTAPLSAAMNHFTGRKLAVAISFVHVFGVLNRVEDNNPNDILLFKMPYSAPIFIVVFNQVLLEEARVSLNLNKASRSSPILSVSSSKALLPLSSSSAPKCLNPSNTNSPSGVSAFLFLFQRIKPISVKAMDTVRLSKIL